jgi:uncharacterized membrane protein
VPKVLTGDTDTSSLAPMAAKFSADPHFSKVVETVEGRCSMCHAQEPVWEGIARAPKGVILDNEKDIAAHAREIYLQAGRSHAMPPGNVTEVTADERKLLVAWFESTIAEKKM